MLRRRLELVTGDRVQWRKIGRGEGVVESRDERHSVLARPDARGNDQVMAANVNQVVVVTSPVPAISPPALDAYFVAAEHLGLSAALVINKCDLITTEQMSERLADYEAAGYPTFGVSAHNGTGLDALRAHLQGKLSVFIGPSGVGKSSLTSILIPGAEAAVGDLVRDGTQGAHTTSASRLYPLDGESVEAGALIDSPGIREFALWKVSPHDIAQGFPEIRALAPQCRFRDCLHLDEPDCAVHEAIEAGAISDARFGSYRTLLELYTTPR